MRICIVVDFYPPHIGGGEIFVSRIAEGLAASGDKCLVITSRTSPAATKVEQKRNLTIVRIGNPSFSGRFAFAILSVPAIIARAKDCDIIHGTSYGGAIPAYLAAKILRKKSVYMVYEFMGGLWKQLERNWIKSAFYRLVEKLIVRLSFDRFVAISRYTRNCLRLMGVADSKLEIVYGGENSEVLNPDADYTAIRRDLGFKPDDFVYAAYGRAGITKGIEYFVDAIPLIMNKVPRAKFLLILTRSDRKIWAQIQHTLNTVPRESYRLIPGMPYNQLRDHLGVSDCIVVPSLSEGFGLAVLEACALKKKVIATDAGSIPEVMYGDHLMVKPGSSSMLAEACYRAFCNRLDHFPQKEFSWRKTVDQTRTIYDEILRTA